MANDDSTAPTQSPLTLFHCAYAFTRENAKRTAPIQHRHHTPAEYEGPGQPSASNFLQGIVSLDYLNTILILI